MKRMIAVVVSILCGYPAGMAQEGPKEVLEQARQKLQRARDLMDPSAPAKDWKQRFGDIRRSQDEALRDMEHVLSGFAKTEPVVALSTGHPGADSGDHDPECPSCRVARGRPPVEDVSPPTPKPPDHGNGTPPREHSQDDAERWGHIKSDLRKAFESVKIDDLPPHYRELLEEYYKKLAEIKD